MPQYFENVDEETLKKQPALGKKPMNSPIIRKPTNNIIKKTNDEDEENKIPKLVFILYIIGSILLSLGYILMTHFNIQSSDEKIIEYRKRWSTIYILTQFLSFIIFFCVLIFKYDVPLMNQKLYIALSIILILLFLYCLFVFKKIGTIFVHIALLFQDARQDSLMEYLKIHHINVLYSIDVALVMIAFGSVLYYISSLIV